MLGLVCWVRNFCCPRKYSNCWDIRSQVYTKMPLAFYWWWQGKWENAWNLFEEMEAEGIKPDHIVCSSLMVALNKGSQPKRVLQLFDLMRENHIPLNQSSTFEILSACSLWDFTDPPLLFPGIVNFFLWDFHNAVPLCKSELMWTYKFQCKTNISNVSILVSFFRF